MKCSGPACVTTSRRRRHGRGIACRAHRCAPEHDRAHCAQSATGISHFLPVPLKATLERDERGPEVPGVRRMRATRLSLAVALLPLAVALWAPGQALSADPTSPAGLWQTVDDDTKQPTGWFLISNHDGVYAGIIAKMFLMPGENPNVVCDQCKDDRHDHPWL